MSDQPRRFPGSGAIVAIALLMLPVLGVTWWLTRSKGDAASGVSPADLDVVCLGRVDGRKPVAHLEPAMLGKVVELFVSEGDTVKAGQNLLKLNDETFLLKVEEAKKAIEAAEIEVKLAQLEQMLHPGRKTRQEAAIAAAVDRVAAAKGLYQEKKTAKTFGTVTSAEIIASEAEVRQLEFLLEAEKGKLEELEKVDPGLKVRAAELKKSMAETTLEQAKKMVRDCILRAPMDGVILRVQTSVGETVVPSGNVPAIVFLPGGELIIRAELEQEFLGRVQPGMKATVRDDVRSDSPTWTGTVLRMGNWVARKRSLLFDPGELNDVRTVECIITLDGKPEGLLIGQRMRVRIGKQE